MTKGQVGHHLLHHGVLEHAGHLGVPKVGMKLLARVLAPGAPVLSGSPAMFGSMPPIPPSPPRPGIPGSLCCFLSDQVVWRLQLLEDRTTQTAKTWVRIDRKCQTVLLDIVTLEIVRVPRTHDLSAATGMTEARLLECSRSRSSKMRVLDCCSVDEGCCAACIG